LATGNFAPEVDLLIGFVANEGSIIVRHEQIEFFDLVKPKNMTLTDAQKFAKNWFKDESIFDVVNNKYLTEQQSRDSNQIRDSLVNAIGDYYFKCPTLQFGKQIAQFHFGDRKVTPAGTGSETGSKPGQVYAFYFEEAASFDMLCNGSTWARVCHASDLPLVFGQNLLTDEDRKYSELIMDIWSTFARTGSPPPMGSNTWKPHEKLADGDVKLNVMKLTGGDPTGNSLVDGDELFPMCKMWSRFYQICWDTPAEIIADSSMRPTRVDKSPVN